MSSGPSDDTEHLGYDFWMRGGSERRTKGRAETHLVEKGGSRTNKRRHTLQTSHSQPDLICLERLHNASTLRAMSFRSLSGRTDQRKHEKAENVWIKRKVARDEESDAKQRAKSERRKGGRKGVGRCKRAYEGGGSHLDILLMAKVAKTTIPRNPMEAGNSRSLGIPATSS